MADYDNTNRWTLFRNEKKESDKHPDYTGSINIEGVEFWLSAWIQESKTGKKFFSGQVRPKDDKPKQAKTVEPDPFDDSDIPF